MVPAGAVHAPGVIILDSDADAPSSRSRDLARRLVQAGYAALTLTRDPLSGAAVLRRQSAVRGDDLAIIGYGAGASSVLATIVERYTADVAQPPVFRSAVAFGPDCARRYGDWVGHSLANLAGPGSTGAPHRGDVASAGLYRTATPLLIARRHERTGHHHFPRYRRHRRLFVLGTTLGSTLIRIGIRIADRR
jgi:hypothetical protein